MEYQIMVTWWDVLYDVSVFIAVVVFAIRVGKEKMSIFSRKDYEW